MFTRWLWQLKWALVIAIFAGPAIAYFSYEDANRIDRVMANGELVSATVTGGSSTSRRRGGTTYRLELDWVDSVGAAHHENLQISSQYAAQIFTDDYVTIETADLRYLPSEAEPTVLVADAPQQVDNDWLMVWLGIGAGVLGLIAAPIWFWLEARDKSRDNDIDRTLAEMRARDASQQPQS